MTQDQAFERLGAAIYAAVFNSELVNEAIAAFEGTGVRVRTLSLEAHLGLDVGADAAPHHCDGYSAPADVHSGPQIDTAEFDLEFLRRMHITLDSPPPPERSSS